MSHHTLFSIVVIFSSCNVVFGAVLIRWRVIAERTCVDIWVTVSDPQLWLSQERNLWFEEGKLLLVSQILVESSSLCNYIYNLFRYMICFADCRVCNEERLYISYCSSYKSQRAWLVRHSPEFNVLLSICIWFVSSFFLKKWCRCASYHWFAKRAYCSFQNVKSCSKEGY